MPASEITRIVLEQFVHETGKRKLIASEMSTVSLATDKYTGAKDVVLRFPAEKDGVSIILSLSLETAQDLRDTLNKLLDDAENNG